MSGHIFWKSQVSQLSFQTFALVPGSFNSDFVCLNTFEQNTNKSEKWTWGILGTSTKSQESRCVPTRESVNLKCYLTGWLIFFHETIQHLQPDNSFSTRRFMNPKYAITRGMANSEYFSKGVSKHKNLQTRGFREALSRPKKLQHQIFRFFPTIISSTGGAVLLHRCI